MKNPDLSYGPSQVTMEEEEEEEKKYIGVSQGFILGWQQRDSTCV